MITEIDKTYIKNLVKEGKRDDGRDFLQFRDMKIETGYVKNAEGSALVTLGDTKVLVGVKMEVGEPFPDTPDEGILIVNAELVPIASPEFESGPPDENAIELARVVDRGIRESKAINLKKLCIKEGERVWIVFVDIHIISDGGNLMDASSIGAIAALLDTKIPKIEEDETINREEYTGKLEISKIPISCTVNKISGKLLVDPTYEEEEATEGKITITTIDGAMCAMQKSGVGGFTADELNEAIKISMEKGKEIREKYFKNFVK
ncbi:MAG: exosome complex protein Rrp42 [Candidatus Aenigmarchaeota archaeon]|nr:exosome complex protein Rrp42 [Candidatus Aenigmarchaeota archaeon]